MTTSGRDRRRKQKVWWRWNDKAEHADTDQLLMMMMMMMMNRDGGNGGGGAASTRWSSAQGFGSWKSW